MDIRSIIVLVCVLGIISIAILGYLMARKEDELRDKRKMKDCLGQRE